MSTDNGPTLPPDRRAPDPEWSDFAPNLSRPLAIAGVILVLSALLAIGASGGGSGGGSNGGADPGEPFSPQAQSIIAQMANMRGWRLRATADTGRCEMLNQVVEHMPADHEVTLTKENAEAATGPNGSLFVTMNGWSNGDPEILQAVQDCTPYFVGTTVGTH